MPTSTATRSSTGGEALVSRLATGEARAYNTRGGFFNQVSPNRPVFAGGPGAWEFVARLSCSDLNGGTRNGGTFWRFTPTVTGTSPTTPGWN
jgi:phosphate-selective porin OprO and OprP